MKRRLFLQIPLVVVPLVLQGQTIKVDRSEEAFKVAADVDRYNQAHLGPTGTSRKLTGKDTNGDMFIYETYSNRKGGPAFHLHQDQDEWLRVIDGEYIVKAREETFRCQAGDSVFVPRNTPHAYAKVNEGPGGILIIFQPAGKMEEFFLERAEKRKNGGFADQTEEEKFWLAYGMKLLGPPLAVN
jgi:quercetin dioxygenase-like cupin family protein